MYRGVREFSITISHIVAHPKELHRVPQWVREMNARPLDLRTPWWPYEIIEQIRRELPHPSRVLEFGGGGSSLWLVDRGATLTVVEHHPGWMKQLRELLPASAEQVCAPPTDDGTITSSVDSGYFDDYVGVADRYPDATFDLVIVDGRARVECAIRALPKVKPGGMLLLDDSDRPRYRRVHEALSDWRRASIRGLKPGNNFPSTTSVWWRPTASAQPPNQP